jgi:hypothetical protein
MEWQIGAWIECESSREKGQIEPYDGKSVCVSLGEGITLFGSPDALERLGWKPVANEPFGD